MDVIAQYKYLGKSYGVESLTNGKIYDCIGYDGSIARIGHEIQDIYMEWSINLTDRNDVYTGQKYIIIFNRAEIEKLVIYLNKLIKCEK